MSKQQELQSREDPDAAEIIKLHNIAVLFGNQKLMIAVKCRALLAKQRMIRDIVKPIRVVTRRLKHQAASLNLNYEY
jgi:DNA-binding cell septation regulator SpoVG